MFYLILAFWKKQVVCFCSASWWHCWMITACTSGAWSSMEEHLSCGKSIASPSKGHLGEAQEGAWRCSGDKQARKSCCCLSQSLSSSYSLPLLWIHCKGIHGNQPGADWGMGDQLLEGLNQCKGWYLLKYCAFSAVGMGIINLQVR